MKLHLLLLSFVAFGSHAQAPNAQRLIGDLSRCDGAFFSSVASDRAAMSAVSPLSTSSGPAAFAVPERRHPVESRVIFKQPLNAGGLSVIGYFDEISELPQGMSSYSWGFLVAATVEATSSTLGPLVWEAARLRKDGEVFVRSEVWRHAAPEQGWARVITESGLPKQGTVERVLLVEPYDGETRFIRLGCSIQGNVTDRLLRELRPDLRQ